LNAAVPVAGLALVVLDEPPPPHAATVSAAASAHAATARVLRLVMSGTSPFTEAVRAAARSGLACPRIKCVTQPVTEKIEGQNRNENGQARNYHVHGMM
jgi:hypothetical protein